MDRISVLLKMKAKVKSYKLCHRLKVMREMRMFIL